MRPLLLHGGIYTDAFVTAMLVWYLPEAIGSFFQRPQAGASRRDRGSYALLLISIWAGVAMGFALANSFSEGAIPWNPPAVFGLGIACMIAGVVFRWYSIRILGTSFSRVVAVHMNQQVVQSGPYRWIRHPTYAGTLLTLFGIGLALGNWASLIVILLAGLIGHLYRVKVEEQALVEELGGTYVEYMHRTKRFIPFIW